VSLRPELSVGPPDSRTALERVVEYERLIAVKTLPDLLDEPSEGQRADAGGFG